MNVRFLSPAETEMFEAAAYYEMQAQDLGVNLINIIDEAIAEIVKNPTIWPEVEPQIR